MSDQFDIIQKAIDAGKPIKICLHVVSDESEKEISYILNKVLSKYSQNEHIHPLYTITKEMAINAVKANIKRAVFKDLNLSLDNGMDYKKGLLLLKEKMSEKNLSENSKRLRELNLHVEIDFNYNERLVEIKVFNNVPLTREEDLRIRKKFQMAQKYSSIADFYLEQMDQAEGAGIGIIMILMLLKEQGIHHKNFMITSDHEKYTLAQLKFIF